MRLSIDLVVKLGGSLQCRSNLRALCVSLDRSLRGMSSIVIPGGGLLADGVRNLDKLHSLDPGTAHGMALLAVDQYGLMIGSFLPRGITVKSEEEAAAACQGGALPVLLPSSLVMKENPLPESWDVTSDSIACWAARRFGAKSIKILKDDLPKGAMTAEEFAEQGWLDKAFPQQFRFFDGKAWIGDGCFPEESISGLKVIEILR